MRTAWLSLIVVWGTAGFAKAVEPLREATVTFDNVEFRAGQGFKMAKCGTLKKGQMVLIHHEENEFYAILPPEGCKSWINHLFLKVIEGPGEHQNAVLQGNADVYCGSPTGPTDVKQVTLPKGQIVELIGPKMSANGTTWYPITPPQNEYRFIPKSNVAITVKPVAPPADRADRSKGGVPGTLMSGKTPSNIGGGSGVEHALWTQADQSYQNGDYAKAEELFRQIYLDMNKSSDYSYDDKLLCYNRRMKCVEMIGPNRNVPADSGRIDISGKPIGGNTTPNWTTASAATGSRSDKPDDVGRETTSKPLYLRKAQFTLDGKATYALVSDRGDVGYYVTLQPGVSVESMVGKLVEATGTPKTRGDLGVPFMVVSRVVPAK